MVCTSILSRSDGRLFNISWFRAKTKSRTVTIKDLLFADNAAMVSHQQDGLQRLMDRLSDAYAFSISQSAQRRPRLWDKVHHLTPSPPCITVYGGKLEVVHQLQYLDSNATETISLDVELSKRIGKASTTLSKLPK